MKKKGKREREKERKRENKKEKIQTLVKSADSETVSADRPLLEPETERLTR